MLLRRDLRESVLTLAGPVSAPDGPMQADVLEAYQSGTSFRRITQCDLIDQSKIDAKFGNGVLRLELPKVEKARPRQLPVRTD